MKAIEVKDITKKYGGLKVLRHLSLSIAPGERRAIIGPNGTGKTTLFNHYRSNQTGFREDLCLWQKCHPAVTLSPCQTGPGPDLSEEQPFF